MSTKPVFVTASMQAQPGKAAALEQAARALVAPTSAEPGCRLYELYRLTDRDDALMFFECWQSRQALEEHLRQPHVRDFMSSADSLLECPVAVSVWEKIAGDPEVSA